MKSVLSLALSVIVLSASAVASAQGASCREEAQQYVNGPNGRKFSAATFMTETAVAEPIRIDRVCTGDSCELAYFSEKPQTLTLPKDHVPTSSYGTAAKPEWRAMPRRNHSQCAAVSMIVFAKASAEVSTDSSDTGSTKHDKQTVTAPAAVPASRFNTDITGALSAYHERRQAPGLKPTVGTSQGLEDVVADTLQIVGQIVADRASAEAYALLKARLQKLLGCPDPTAPVPTAPVASATPPVAAPTPAVKATLPKPTFPATCRVLQPLRMQDIATSQDVLLGAISQDALQYLQNVQNGLTPGQKKAEEIGAAAVITAVVVPLIIRPKLLADSTKAQVVVAALESYVDKHSAGLDGTNKAQRAIAAGVLAYTRCVSEAAEASTSVSTCDFAAYADGYSGDDAETQLAARALAGQLISIATLNLANGQADALGRVIHAVDTLFASSCMLASAAEVPPPALEFKCPDAPDQIDLSNIPATAWLSFAQPVVDAALERDSNALMVAIAHAVHVFSGAEYNADHQRAFLLIGSLVQYAATYAQQTDANAQQLHDQRTKILESLTEAMSNRTARDGDNIWSLGGSLRLVGGVRVGGTSPALLSPLGLPLGVGFDHVAGGGTGGVHLEFSPVDLGQYVSYDNNAVVHTPKVADAISPSFTLAAGWGSSMPLVFGATVGYSPTFRLDPTQSTKGTFNAGVTLGIYVPLIDMN